MAEWTEWQDIEDELYEDGTTKGRGVYQVRIVNTKGEPIPLSRFGGVDEEAIYYIGKSGIGKTGKGSCRTELRRFLSNRPGGEVYDGVSEDLEEKPGFTGYRLEYRIRATAKPMTSEASEQLLLDEYLHKYCELPPGNNSMPRKAVDRLFQTLPTPG